MLVASLVDAPCPGQVEAALAESASWRRGSKGLVVVMLALCLILVTRSRPGGSVGECGKLGPLMTTTA